MKTRIGRLATAGLLVSVVAALAGCGGGGSHNENFGVDTNPQGGKSITRTLENDSDQYLTVELTLNGRDHLDTFEIRPRDYTSIRVDNLTINEWVEYRATFEDGDTTSGRFSEDGRTIFTHGDSRAAGGRIIATDVNGRAAVKEGGTLRRIDARKAVPK
jgi:hypothetical protein